MRVDRVEVTIKIPVPIDKPDGNGIMYSEEAIKKACEDSKERPIVQFDGKGNEVIIGKGTARYENKYIIVNGICWHGGTCESVKYNENNVVTSIELSSFGFTLE